MEQENNKLLKEKLKSFLDTKECCDCEFEVGDENIEAHKLVLSVSSPVFKAMFYGDLCEDEGPIKITDIQPKGFSGMLEFMYTDDAEFTSTKHATMVLQAAMKYIIPSLESLCMDYIKFTLCAANVCEVYEFAKLQCLSDVSDMCIELFKNNTSAILDSEDFKKAGCSTVQAIAEQDSLTLESELQLFTAIEQWALQESQSRGITMAELLPEIQAVVANIRFLALDIKDLKDIVEHSPLLTEKEKISIFMTKEEVTLIPYPEKFTRCTDIRPGGSLKKEWRLERTFKIKVPICIYSGANPFPKKRITVSKPVILTGLKIFCTNFIYRLKVLTGKWEIVIGEFKGSITFPDPIYLKPNEVYWIEIQTTYAHYHDVDFCDDESVTYKSHNTIIQMSDHYSQIQELWFKDV